MAVHCQNEATSYDSASEGEERWNRAHHLKAGDSVGIMGSTGNRPHLHRSAECARVRPTTKSASAKQIYWFKDCGKKGISESRRRRRRAQRNSRNDRGIYLIRNGLRSDGIWGCGPQQQPLKEVDQNHQHPMRVQHAMRGGTCHTLVYQAAKTKKQEL